MDKMMKKIPALRFLEFKGEWEEVTLGDIAIFKKGKGLSKAEIAENGSIECIRYGELYSYYKEVIKKVVSKTNVRAEDLIFSEKNDVIIPASGETQIEIAKASCVMKDGVALGSDLNIIKSKLHGVFLSYYLNNKKKKDIAKLSQGISVVHLYASQLKSLKLYIPENSEQQKIAAFLTAVDDKINRLTRKKTLLEQYKKGVMQKIFSQEIRFKDKAGKDFPEWEVKRLGGLVEIKSGFSPSKCEYVDNGTYPFLKVEELNNCRKYQKESRYYSNDNNNLIEAESIIFPKRGAAILINKIRINKIPVLMDSNLMAIRPKNTDLNFEFLYYQIYNEKLYKIADTSTIPQINNKHIEPYKICLPTPPEQQKIADFLTGIDKKIELVNTQLEKTKAWKKGLLQQMFV